MARKKNHLAEVSRKSDGTYTRDLGWEAHPTKPGEFRQIRFYLGKDGAEAVIRALRLEQVWAAVEQRWQRTRDSVRPVWDETTEQIGRAVARGDLACVFDSVPEFVPDPDGVGEVEADPAALVLWMKSLQDDFPMIRLSLGDSDTEREGNQYWEGEGRRLIDTGRKLLRRNTRQNLHDALDGFAAHLRAQYTDGAGRLSLTGQVAEKDVRRIKEHQPDMPLGDFDLAAVDGMVAHWLRRPPTRNKSRAGQPAAVKTVRNTIKRIRMFIRWLHKAKEWDWRKPDDYEVSPAKVRLTPDELAARVNADQVQTYTVEQLGLLWKYAKPRERVWMLLALNCGFGIAELVTLQRNEIHRGAKHRKFRTVGNYLQRIRTKNQVYAEWQLWDLTVAGLDWCLGERPRNAGNTVLVDGKGKPLAEQTSGGNRAQEIPNAWRALVGRVQVDHPDFPRLSFNKLRKTAINAVRDIAGGEVAAVFAAHGAAVPSDGLIDLYSNRPFDRVFAACRTWGERLAPVFGLVAEPFAATKRKHRKSAKYQVEKARVTALREAGRTYQQIANETGVSFRMVRVYCDGLAKPNRDLAGK